MCACEPGFVTRNAYVLNKYYALNRQVHLTTRLYGMCKRINAILMQQSLTLKPATITVLPDRISKTQNDAISYNYTFRDTAQTITRTCTKLMVLQIYVHNCALKAIAFINERMTAWANNDWLAQVTLMLMTKWYWWNNGIWFH